MERKIIGNCIQRESHKGDDRKRIQEIKSSRRSSSIYTGKLKMFKNPIVRDGTTMNGNQWCWAKPFQAQSVLNIKTLAITKLT